MTKKLNILLVHNYYQIPGGEDTVVENEKRLLEEHGHNVILYTRHNEELKNLSKWQKLLLPFSTIFNFRTYREVKKIIREEKIDVLHVHNTLNLISPSVYYAGVKKKIPVVQTLHNFRLLCPGATFYRDGAVCEECLKKGLFRAVKHRCYRGSTLQTLACVISTKIHRALGIYGKIHYIALTQFNRDKILNLKKIKKEKVFVKPNFTTAPIRDEGSVPGGFLYAGRMEEIKGVKILLEAWRIMGKEAPHLSLCGSGELEDWCQEYIKEHDLNAVYLGQVDNQTVREYMRKSVALLMPTQWYEGFPMTILEAFSVGTPVLVSDLGNAGSLIQEGVSGEKFGFSSPESLAQAVKKMMSTPYRVAQKEFAPFTPEQNYQELLGIYKKLLEKG